MVKKPKHAPRAIPKSAAVAPAAATAPVTSEFLLEPEVAARCRMTRSQIWKLEHAGQFPKRKRYGFRRVGWVAAEIDAWLSMGIDGWLEEQSKAKAKAKAA